MMRTILRGIAVAATALACCVASPAPIHAEESVGGTEELPLLVEIERTDNLGDTVYVGDRLTFNISYTNLSDVPVVAFPRWSNMSGVAVEGKKGNCRWANLKPQQKATCTLGYYVLTEDEVKNGYTPSVKFDVTRDRDGNDVIAELPPTVYDEPIEVQPGTRPPAPHPSEITQEMPDGTKRVLASNGLAGYTCHRIPALTTAPNGWIIAAWDGRPNGCGDAPEPNSIIGRISQDGGKTWTTPITIAAGKMDAPKHGYSDPSFVTDRETGEIFAFFVKSYDVGIRHSVAGTDPNARNVIHAAVSSSTDNGQTWSEPRIITDAITSDPTREVGRFATSGEGIQLRYGEHKGRLVQQFAVNYRAGGLDMKAVSVYSDDHGQTWTAGTAFGVADGYRMDENKVVELSDGTLMVNSRIQGPGPVGRWVAYSHDGGQTYSQPVANTTLVDPQNNASIIRAYPNAAENSRCAKILLFSNAASNRGRVNGTIRISYDDGKTWNDGKVFEAGSMSYSTMTALPESGRYGILYEAGGYNITYMPFSMEWLGQDTGCSLVDAEAQTDPETPGVDAGTQTDPETPGVDAGTQTDPETPGVDAGTQTDPEDAATPDDTTQPGETAKPGEVAQPSETVQPSAKPGAKPTSPTTAAEPKRRLAATGATVSGLLLAAGLCAGIGVSAVRVSRRR